MQKPKKSKKFIYNLRTVHKVRVIFEKIEKEKFAKAVQEYELQLKKEKEMKDYEKNQQKQLADKLTGDLDFATILHRQHFLKKYKIDVLEQEEKRKEADQKKEEQRERLIHAIKDRKILDKDKENKRKSWRKLMDKEETKFLDDITTPRFLKGKTQ